MTGSEDDAAQVHHQRKWARTFDWTTLGVLAIIIADIFGGVHLKGTNLRIDMNTWPILVWIFCVALYYKIPEYWQRPTLGQRISSRFSGSTGADSSWR